MTDITISETDFQGLKDKVVLLTGGSSGIGLSTVKILLSHGAKVINGDIHPPPPSSTLSTPDFHHKSTDVTDWTSLKFLFLETLNLYGKIDHVFANASMAPVANYVTLDLDARGEPLEPTYRVLDVNLKGVINTACLGLHYLQKQPSGGSIVLTASSSCFSRFRAADYAIAKHGVLGLLRGLTPVTYPHLPVRVNVLCPSWTESGIVPPESFSNINAALQTSEIPAKAAVMLMASKRHGQMILAAGGRFREIEEAVLLKAMDEDVRGQSIGEDDILVGVLGWLQEQGGAAAGKEAEKIERSDSAHKVDV